MLKSFIFLLVAATAFAVVIPIRDDMIVQPWRVTDDLCLLGGCSFVSPVATVWDGLYRVTDKNTWDEDFRIKENVCLTLGIGCTKTIVDVLKGKEPEKLKMLCKTRGIGCFEVL